MSKHHDEDTVFRVLERIMGRKAMVRALTEELKNARTEERQRVREYILLHMGHCLECAQSQAYQDDPYAELPLCDCAHGAVVDTFDQYEKEQR